MNTSHNRRAKRKFRPNPLAVLATAMGSMLASHRTSVFSRDYNFLNGALRARDWKSLLNWASAEKERLAAFPSEHPGAFTEALPPSSSALTAHDEFLVRKQFVALFEKFAFTPAESGFDPEAAALTAFARAEQRCGRYNLKLRALRNGRGRRPHHALLHEILELARREIAQIIGDEPNLQAMYQLCDFSGGASLGVHGDATNLGRKLLAESWTVTPSCAEYAMGALWSNPQVLALFCEERAGFVCLDPKKFVAALPPIKSVQHNTIAFVPKTAKTHRAIAVEPLLNGFVQKGIDQWMRAALKRSRYHIDLSDQGKNQRWAKWGSLEMMDPLVTLDLSAASDSISSELVRWLLPPAWYVLLNATRSPSYELPDGTIHRYNKFCSMGNGFCFPLETMLFATMASACYKYARQRPQLAVYGDDIIVRQNIALLLTEVLQGVGFKVNRDKSFYHGPFRESCGADWVRGRGVTPVYMRRRIETLANLIHWHNSLYHRPFGKRNAFPDTTLAIRLSVPEQYRYVELSASGSTPLDGGFSVELDEFMASPHTAYVPELGYWVGRRLMSKPAPDSEFQHVLRTQVEYLAILRGASAEQPLSLRRKTKTRLVNLDEPLRKVIAAEERHVRLWAD